MIDQTAIAVTGVMAIFLTQQSNGEYLYCVAFTLIRGR